MRKQILSPFLLILSIFMSQLGPETAVLADDSHVGDIRYSILSEDQFRRLHGTEWEILQGQPVAKDSELREYWGDRNLPDSRGVFLRCANHGRTRDEGNPDGCLDIGTFQGDNFKSHNHGGGDHSHDVICELSAGRQDGRVGNTLAWYPPKHAAFRSANSGHVIASEGGSETRPRNITVNAFVKVRESGPAINRPEISAKSVAQLFNSAEFLKSLREVIIATFRSL